MSMRQCFAKVVLLALLPSFGFGLLAQESHRRPNPEPRKDPADVFNQIEQEQAESPKEEAARKAAARRQRSANLAELQKSLPRLVELAQSLQNRLHESDLETALPADLEKQANELEQVARRVHKQVRNL
jgi:hypothetical protein